MKYALIYIAVVLFLLAQTSSAFCDAISGAPEGVTLDGIPKYWTTFTQPLGGLGTFSASFSFCNPWKSPPMDMCGVQRASYVYEGVAGCSHNAWDTLLSPGWYWQDAQAHAVFQNSEFPGYLAIVNVGCGTANLTLKNVTGVVRNGVGYNWTFDLESSNMCSGSASCDQWNDCGRCTTAASGNCGWCAATGKCYQGTSTGPVYSTCPYGWDWLSGQCPSGPTAAPMTYAPPSTPCTQYATCGDCTNSPNGNCGWCAITNMCSQGNANGPSVGSCVSWDWYSRECPATQAPVTPAPDHCAGFATCSACTTASAPYCGWCANTNTCSSGTANGPSTGSCVAWDWLQNECPASLNLPEPKDKPRSPHAFRPRH